MSAEWVETTLGEVCASQKGAIQTGPFGSQLHASDYVEVGIPVVMPANIGADGGITEDGIARIQQADADRLAQHKLQIGDVIFSRRGDVTRNALVEPHQVGWLCGTGCLKVRLGDESRAGAKFISYCLRLPETKEWLIRHAVGATMPNLNTSILSAVPIAVPPLAEQKKITTVLRALDDRIVLLRETNATLEAMAQALFKSWFVDFDPVHANAGTRAATLPADLQALFPSTFADTTQGPVPEGWSFVALEGIASVVMGLSPKGDTYNSGGEGIPLINGPVEFGEYFPVKTKWTSSASRVASKGDLIFCVRGSTTGRRVISDGDYCIGRGVCAIRANNGFDSFIYQTINFGLSQLLGKTTGSVFPNLSAPDIKGFTVLQPSRNVLAEFQHITNPFVKKIQENHHYIDTLTTLRDTLLPRLISGQLRLPDAEAALAKVSA